jgi:hypothetical protein
MREFEKPFFVEVSEHRSGHSDYDGLLPVARKRKCRELDGKFEGDPNFGIEEKPDRNFSCRYFVVGQKRWVDFEHNLKGWKKAGMGVGVGVEKSHFSITYSSQVTRRNFMGYVDRVKCMSVI